MAHALSSFRLGYGVDASEDQLTIVRAVRARGRVQVTTEGRGSRTELADLLARVQDELDQGQATVAAALPVTESFARRVSASLPSLAKARKVLPSLLDVQLPVAVEHCACAYLEVRAGAPGQVEALALAARHEDVRARVAKLAGAALAPLALDHEGVALWDQSLRDLALPADTLRLLIHLDTDHAALVLGRSDRLLAVHGSRTAWSDSPAGWAAGAAALARRIRQLLQAELGADPGNLQWLVSGPLAARAPVVQALTQALALDGPSRLVVHEDPTSFLARAVARRSVSSGAWDVNFLGGELEPEPIRRRRDRAERRLLGSCAAAGLALLVASLGWMAFMNVRKERLQIEITALAQSISGMPRVPRGQEVMTVQRALDEQNPDLQPFRDARREPAVGLLAPFLDAAARHQVNLDALKLGVAEFETSGRAPTSEACEGLAEAARDRRWQTDLHREDAGGGVRFVLKGYR